MNPVINEGEREVTLKSSPWARVCGLFEQRGLFTKFFYWPLDTSPIPACSFLRALLRFISKVGFCRVCEIPEGYCYINHRSVGY